MNDFRPKEYRDNKKSVILFQGLCKGCGLCLEKCPLKAIKFSEKDLGVYSTPTVQIDIAKCSGCGICEVACPDSALKVKKAKTA